MIAWTISWTMLDDIMRTIKEAQTQTEEPPPTDSAPHPTPTAGDSRKPWGPLLLSLVITVGWGIIVALDGTIFKCWGTNLDNFQEILKNQTNCLATEENKIIIDYWAKIVAWSAMIVLSVIIIIIKIKHKNNISIRIIVKNIYIYLHRRWRQFRGIEPINGGGGEQDQSGGSAEQNSG